jgi:multidrug efflux pump subunit AcrA (membrane-fusion protein)
VRQEIDEINIRSEEVQEILGTPPPWLVRWGTILAFMVFVLLAWLSFLVKYPEVVEDKIRIYYKEPSVGLRASLPNYIDEVLVRNNQIVDSGQTIIAFKNSGNFLHILTLEDRIASLNDYNEESLMRLEIPPNLSLGELQSDLQDFLDKRQQVLNGDLRENLEALDLRTLRSRVSRLEISLGYLRQNRQTLDQQLSDTEQEQVNTEHLVKVDRASTAEVNEIKRRLADLKKEANRTDAEIRERETELSSSKLQINALEKGLGKGDKLSNSMLKDSFFKLLARLRTWKSHNIIESPINGQVQIVGANVSPNNFVNGDEELVVIVPAKSDKVVGRMSLPFNGSGKVKVGQKVIVKLESLPYEENGSLIGTVSWKSRVPSEQAKRMMIPIEVVFPNGLVTTTGKQVASEDELLGDARVITEEKRFIERVFQRFRAYRE